MDQIHSFAGFCARRILHSSSRLVCTREEQEEEAQKVEKVEVETVDNAAMQIDKGEEFFQFDSYESPDDLADMEKHIVMKIEASKEDETVEV
ncbi:hypothetical protein TSAR_016388 [Trichomalopsis sarcophagae]|uniref:Uncharacterized protein n=1 Tax=Trichomalopsis sarcophagae TaxID=543379 RepID=A0A232EJR1_9HYME|nr:hypothetical protein TSAR_016388 [Trichomalopsis sarcophagae]